MGVLQRDARRLSLEAQEDLRRRAVAAVQAGHSQANVATVLGVSPKTVWRWVDAVRRNGSKALKAGRRGRRPGEQKALDPKQEARVRKAVLGRFPDQVALPGLAWTRPQVRQLIQNWFGVGLSLVTVGKYLRSWGLSPQKPIRRAYEQNPQAVARWLAEQYPTIEATARREKALILWLDQTGLRSDSSVGKGWALPLWPAGWARRARAAVSGTGCVAGASSRRRPAGGAGWHAAGRARSETGCRCHGRSRSSGRCSCHISAFGEDFATIRQGSDIFAYPAPVMTAFGGRGR
ncbi:IS630 family transposase [Micromonosporaceae bacterium Da 78-11]